MSVDWALIVPIPASVAANTELLFAQFGETVPLVHCLLSTRSLGRGPGGAVVAVAAELYADVKALLAAHGMSATVVSVGGQGTRRECLSAGLATLDPRTTHVLVHDLSRPLASSDLALRILTSLRRGNQLVVPALELVDSIKTVNGAGTVVASLDRASLRFAQFPRGFHRRQLAEILAAHDGHDFDELALASRRDLQTTIIEGDPDAFALEIPRDVGLADAIHSRRLARQR